MEITLEAGQRKVLVFQFLSVAVRFADVAHASSSAGTLEECAAQMREAYDSALLLCRRVSFTAEDCCAFDLGSWYVQESFGVLQERARNLRSGPGEGASGDGPRPSEWEPMWGDRGPDREPSAAFNVFAARSVHRHLRRVEDLICTSVSRQARKQASINPSRFC